MSSDQEERINNSVYSQNEKFVSFMAQTFKKIPIMKNVFILFLCFCLVSCNRNDDDMEIPTNFSRKITITVNGEHFEVAENKKKYIGGNTNCNGIFVSTVVSNGSKEYRLDFQLLKNGELMRVKCLEVPAYKLYLTPDFNPKSTFQISDFHYDEATNDVKFSFTGTLYRENEINSQNTKTIHGTVDIKSFEVIDCALPFYQNISYNSTDFSFNTIHDSRTKNETTLEQNHYFHSNNGYRLTLKTHDDLWKLPTGTYPFDETSTPDRVLLEKHIGNRVATQPQTSYPNDWENLKTIGNFTIDTKEIVNSNKKISGKITMSVYQGNQKIAEINNMSYTAGSFE